MLGPEQDRINTKSDEVVEIRDLNIRYIDTSIFLAESI